MGEGLCGSSMFGSDRWSVGVTPMTAGKLKIASSRLYIGIVWVVVLSESELDRVAYV